MSISDWFKKLFSSQSAAGGGQLTNEDAFLESEQVADGELSEYEEPEPTE